MSDTKDVNGKGKTRSPNPGARNVIVQDLIAQGFSQKFNLPLAKMTYYLSEEKDESSSTPKTCYFVQWQGNVT